MTDPSSSPSQLHLLSLQYELALRIGQDLHLDSMLRRFFPPALKLLACRAAYVWLQAAPLNAALAPPLRYAYPRSDQARVAGDREIQEGMAAYRARLRGSPGEAWGTAAGSRFLHFFPLGRQGVALLVREGRGLSATECVALAPIFERLATACQACLDHEAVEELRAAQQAQIRRMQAIIQREKELSDLKSRFIAMTSHEFRTPLTTILSSAELLEHYQGRLPEEEKAELFASIRGAIQRTADMLDKVLLIGKAEAGKLEFRPRPVDLTAFCREVLEEYRLSLPMGFELVLDSRLEEAAALPTLDPALLRQIIDNLLANAVKYSPAGGTVTLALGQEEAAVTVTVSDQGIGIPAADLPRIFDSFHRAANVGNIGGTGLGLAIVRNAVELHGGRISVCSENGRGSRFQVVLPHQPLARREEKRA